MGYRRKLQLLAVVVMLGCALYVFVAPGRGKVIDRWQTGNAAISVGVTVYGERPSLPGLGGAYYVFQSAPVGSTEWKEVMTFRHDNTIPIPHEQVRFVNDRIGYVFMGWKFAVTTDGGAAWSVWDATQNLPRWECCHYQLIKDVRIEADGGGTMTLNSSAEPPVPAKLYTKNYGQHWSEQR